jgi:DNA-directed RNA polymerase specialized sigma24 family protein
MSGGSENSVLRFFDLLQQGDEAAAAHLWELFVPRLLGLARRTLASQPRLNGLAEDVVQSAFASFFQRARGGQFAIENRDDLWNLLGVMTVRKARRALRREATEKRGGGRVHNEAALTQTPHLPPALDAVPASAFGVEFDLYAEELLAELPAELRCVAVLRLMGHTNQETARKLDWTVRKVERKLQLIRLGWEKELHKE